MIEHIERLLKSRIGLDAESVGRSVIERAVRQRMAATGLHELESYWTTLGGSPREQQALVEAVVVPETWFFRYPESFNALASLALERQAQLHGARPLRLISLPCSSGEEPYSIAMALLDAGFAPGQFQIDALDVSDKVLEQARKGLYGRNSFRGDALAFRDRFFREQAGSFLLDERVRGCVRLRTGNLLDGNLFAGETPYDFIFCRNLLIYFDRPTQVRVLELLKRQLQAEGTLFIGPAEASLASQNGLQALGRQQTFAFRLAPSMPAKPATMRAAASRTRPSVTPVARPTIPSRARPAPKKLQSQAPRPQTQNEDTWAEVASLANAGRSAQARQLSEQHLQTHGPSAAAYYWLGLLSDVDGQSAQACGYYRKAIYLEPQHREALTHLAAHLEAQGDPAGAQRLYRRAQTPGVGDDD
ncbi:chemotaxis protein methyltransferase WspC [Ectopseudomonas oleovorans]|uniref:Chemotaxis protein methyltransferase WspC n=1 Tax=Ectopseudomonas oleovorans TaxID=301 RepID=A0A397M131_ECTOL|nr:CheR family methyltransferase [Pseudomonas oleovorans]RIA18690.1 chemotaxis protein methyltransferase WspC [Pseudomonas oleovorans]